jgi:ornithine cyclodeaminase/alanine dehydrogenase-like protein (mu-crystallin family)
MIHRFTEEQVLAGLPMPVAIECLRSAFAAYGRGEAQNQPRRRLMLSTGSVLHSLAASYGAYFGTKVYSTNVKHGAWFQFLLYDAETAKPLAQFEANHLGQIRTGAATGLAVDLLAPEQPLKVAIIGSGFQARTQVEAIRTVREVEELRVWSRKPENRERFATETEGIAVETAAEACAGADVIVTATFAKQPVIPADAVPEHAIIAAVGTNMADRSEVPPDIIRRARLIADDIEQAKIEAGDLILAGVDWAAVEPLTKVVLQNTKAGENRRLTVFKSVGLGLEDLAVAAHLYESAATPERPSADPSPATR